MIANPRPRSTPVLIGRDDLLALGRRRAEDARGGRGHMLFLAGEAGIGKTRLLGSITRSASQQGMRVVRAAASSGDLELAGGLLLDLGHGLANAPGADARAAGAALLDRLRADVEEAGDPHRRRRLLVLEVADAVASLAESPVLLGLEDLHWADDLTLEVLANVARRLPSLPMLVVGTYRSDELYPRVPMREWRARLLTQRQAEEARLARLDAEQTGAMASLLLGETVPPRQLVEALHVRSDGIPLHVEEILAAMALDPSTPVPDTLTDAILARRLALTPEAAGVADAAAIIGRAFDLDLAAAVMGEPVEHVATAIDELLERYFLVPAAQAGWFEFRHVLISDALSEAIPLARRRALHERVARGAAERAELSDDAFLSVHFEAAGLRRDAHERAQTAAGRAVSLSAHREALDLYRRAIRCAPPELPARARAELLAARAAEEASTDDNDAAAGTYVEARELLLAEDERGRAAELMAPLVAVRHLLGDDLETRVALLGKGLSEAAESGEPDRARGRLEAGISAAYMLDRRLDEAIEHGERAIGLAAKAGDEVTEVNALTTLASVFVFTGRMDEGWAMLEEAIARARRARLEAEAARAYRMIGSSASVLVEYERGERGLREGIEYAERTEQWNHRHYMAAHLGHVLWAVGAWEDAAEVTGHALADGRGGITTRITALHVLGYLAVGRGEWEKAEATLGEARRVGEEMREIQRFSPALWGLAEAAGLRGRAAEAVELTEIGLRASLAVNDAAYLFPYLVTGTRARLDLPDPLAAERWVAEVEAALRRRSIPGTLPAIDHARGLLHLAGGATGRARASLTAARSGWLGRRRAWEGCQAAIDLAQAAHRANRPAEAAALVSEALAEAERMGSSVLRERVERMAAGMHRRGGSVEPWSPLTARQFAVARLIARGRTNAEIAEELTIAPKTVAAHVEHILASLGADRRTEIAAWVGRAEAEAASVHK
ncbi:MAG TPA: AAA family ATPase [Methylomirabilota bacterium]|nr:AAA family ATPase [Methylomirabilota bacterium]